jgi:coenzyme Q-binding protein COQ10
MLVRVGTILPFSCEQVFALAADIERYPEFLTGWISAQIIQREPTICHVDQEVRFGPIRLRFKSTAVLQRPKRIDVTSTDGPFKYFGLSWVIAANSSGSCRISIAASVELQSGILQLAVNPFLSAVVDDNLRAFEARAHTLYPLLPRIAPPEQPRTTMAMSPGSNEEPADRDDHE